jgi:hypothetical protein
MNRMQGWWLAAAGLAMASGVQAQTAWAPLPAAAKAARPAHLAALDELPADSVTAYGRQEAKADGRWEFVLPDGQALRIAGVHAQTHANGDVTWSGYIESAGGNYPALLTRGEHASFGTFATPRGRYRLEGWDGRAWVIREEHEQIDLPAPDEFALAPPPGSGAKLATVGPRPAAPKADATQIDVLFIYTAGLAARYPGTAVQTRVNHLAAIANQAFANSNVAAAVRVVGVERFDYREDNSNLEAIDDVRKAVQPGGNPVVGLLNLRNMRTQRGADIVTLIRPHDVEVRDSCGVGYLFRESANFGINVISDGISGWSVCRDEGFAHELGHNLGLDHQDGANGGQAGSATAFVAPGKFHTLMGSFASGDPQRARALLRFSNPDQRCGGIPCGVPGQSDNAGRARATMGEVAAFMATTDSTPAAVLPPPALDADVDGDGVKESQDAFPFDPAYSSDRDNDGVADALDRFPDNPAESVDTDGDGHGDNSDGDIDNDGVPNAEDALPRVAGEIADADGDGVGDNADPFDDNRREWSDFDHDGMGDNADTDVDGDGADTQGSDLLVASLGTDRVIRLDGDTGRFVAVEIAEPGNEPYALGPQSALAWNAYRRRTDGLVAGDVRRYDGATRKREAIVLESTRNAGVPGLRSGLSAAFTVAPDGTLYAVDAIALSLHRFDAVTGVEQPQYPFGDRPFFNAPPRGLAWHNGLLWTIDKTGRMATVSPSGQVDFRAPPLGDVGIPQPTDVTAFIFGADHQAYVADGVLDVVYRMNPQTGQLSAFVTPGSGGLDRPSGLAFDEQGRLYVSSAANGKVLRYAANGSFIDSFAKVPAGMLADPRSLVFVPRIADRYPKDAARRIRPNVGAWYDPSKSGQGFDIQAMGNSLSVAWYTYDADGRAIWYLASGPLQGSSFTAPLQRFTWNGSAATGTTVGEVHLGFTASDRAQLNWQLGTQTGSQALVHFQAADSVETQFPTAVWYDPQKTGWGLSLTRLGGVLSVTAFVFDKAGNPTWVTGAAGADATEFTLRLLSAPNNCPSCSGNTAPAAVEVGTVRFKAVNDTHAEGGIDLQSDTVEWRHPTLGLQRLSDTPTRPNGDPR